MKSKSLWESVLMRIQMEKTKRSHKEAAPLKKRFHGETGNPKGRMKQWAFQSKKEQVLSLDKVFTMVPASRARGRVSSSGRLCLNKPTLCWSQYSLTESGCWHHTLNNSEWKWVPQSLLLGQGEQKCAYFHCA